MYVCGIENLTFHVYIEVDAIDIMGNGEGGRHAHVKIFWTTRIVLKTFSLSFCTLSLDLY